MSKKSRAPDSASLGGEALQQGIIGRAIGTHLGTAPELPSRAEWAQYAKTLDRARQVAETARAESISTAPDDRPATRMEVATHATRRALECHRRACEAMPAHVWLIRRDGYSSALGKLEDARRSEAGETWWFDVHRRIAFGMLTLPILSDLREQGRLYFSKEDFRGVVRVIDELRHALDGGINLPAIGRLENRGGWHALIDDLGAASDGLRAEIDRSDRQPRAENGAEEREAIARWCRLVNEVRSPSVIADVIRHLCAVAGIKRGRVQIERIVRATLEQEATGGGGRI